MSGSHIGGIWSRLRRWAAGRNYTALKSAGDALAEQANVHVHMNHDSVQCEALRTALVAYRKASETKAGES